MCAPIRNEARTGINTVISVSVCVHQLEMKLAPDWSVHRPHGWAWLGLPPPHGTRKLRPKEIEPIGNMRGHQTDFHWLTEEIDQ